jgi:hypothetical protein
MPVLRDLELCLLTASYLTLNKLFSRRIERHPGASVTIILRRCRMVTYGPSYVERGYGNGRPPVDEGIGEFLAGFDHEANGGVGKLILTPDPSKAMRFAAVNEAILFIQRIPACKRRRSDGRPNRPLTDFGWEVDARLEESFAIDGVRDAKPSACSPVAHAHKVRKLPRRTSTRQPVLSATNAA